MSANRESYFPPDILAGTPALGNARVQSTRAIEPNFFQQPDLPAGAPTFKDLEKMRTGEVRQQYSFHTPDFPTISAPRSEIQPQTPTEKGKIGFGQLPVREPAPLYATATANKS